MKNKKLSVASVIAVAAAGIVGAVNPAQATPLAVTGCGQIPSNPNIQLSRNGEVCEVDVIAAGDYSWTVPNGVDHIYGVLISGGAGDWMYGSLAYAGHSGAVTYLDTTVAGGNIISGTVGAAGAVNADSTQTYGGDTTLSYNSGTPYSVPGGAGVFGGLWCGTGGWYFGQGTGSGTGDPTNCIDGSLNGTIIGTDPNAPTIFSDITASVANGGIVYQQNDRSQFTPGDGGSLYMAPDYSTLVGAPSYSTQIAGDGERGWVKLRYAALHTTVGYDANGATGGTAPVDSTSYFTGDDATVLDNTGSLVRAGYTFAGWNTESNGTGTAYAASATTNVGDTGVTLYAQWNPVQQQSAPVTKKVTTFKGDSDKLIPGMRTQINKFLREVPNGAAISCTGSTSGAKITGFDKKLAKNRALTVCEYARSVRSDITYVLHITPSSSKGVSARHVWMKYTPNVG